MATPDPNTRTPNLWDFLLGAGPPGPARKTASITWASERPEPQQEQGVPMQGLDRHITGNWGEDSVAPEFFQARLLDMQEAGTVINLAPDGDPIWAATIVRVDAERGGNWVLTTEELAFPVLVKADSTVIYYADKPDEEH